jgi:hypothetical protein
VALSKPKLARSLHDDVFSNAGGGSSFPERMRLLCSAYRRYAADARSCQAQAPTPALLDTAALKMAAVLASAAPLARNPQAFARAFGLAGTAFWLTPPITFLGGASPGAVIAAVPTTLEVAILGALTRAAAAGTSAKPQLVADLWSSALDAWTRTVVAAHGPVPACSAPLV